MSDSAHILEVFANLASLLTAGVAVWAFANYQITRRARRLRLEAYLEGERGMGDDGGQRTILHLVSQLGMPEADIIDAAFRSKVIERKVSKDADGKADRLFLVYKIETSHRRRAGRSQF